MISPEQGVGIEFEYDGNRCITLPRTGIFDLCATVHINTYKGMVPWAKHFIASIHISDLSCTIIGNRSGKKFTTNMQPKESIFRRVDVVVPATHNIYCDDFEFGVDKQKLEVKKGDFTSRFDTIEECLDAVELTFKEQLGEPWVLTGSNYEPWEEEKIYLARFHNED